MVIRKVITKANFDETIKDKAKRSFKKVSREVIIINPNNSNRYWIPKSMIPS